MKLSKVENVHAVQQAETMQDILFYPLLLFFWLIIVFLLRSLLKQCTKSSIPIKHPPSPPAMPIIGHLHLLSSVLPTTLQTLATRYGPIMRLRLASTTAVIISNAAVAQELLKHHEMNFVSRPDLVASDSDIYKGFTFVFANYGYYWRFMKKLCMTEILSVARVNSFADIRREETMQLMETLVKCSDEGKECNIGPEIMTVTNNVICRMFMSTRCSRNADERKQVWEFVKEAQDVLGKLFLGELLGPLGKLDLFGHGRKRKAVLMKFDSLVEGIMEEHEKQNTFGAKERKDVMDILLEIYRDENAELKLSRIHIKAFLLDLFMAGTETRSMVKQWILAELINHPKSWEKLREEIDTVVGSKRLVEEWDIPNLLYLQAVVKEGLRLHPSAPLIFRKCEKDCKINGYDLLANEKIIFNLTAIMRDPNSWENPLDFIPERFIAISREHYDPHQMDIRGQNHKFLPFGSGRKGCPGASLASAVIHGVIAKLVQCFDFVVEGGGKIDMEEGPGFSTGMAHPLLCYPITRINPLQLNNWNE